MSPSVGHIPLDGACKACGKDAERNGELPYEPCLQQDYARTLIQEGYLALPVSWEEFTALVEAGVA